MIETRPVNLVSELPPTKISIPPGSTSYLLLIDHISKLDLSSLNVTVAVCFAAIRTFLNAFNSFFF